MCISYVIEIWGMLACEYNVLQCVHLFVACPVKSWNVPSHTDLASGIQLVSLYLLQFHACCAYFNIETKKLWNSKHIFSDPSCQLIRVGTWDSSNFLSLRWSTLVARLQVLSLGPWVLSLNRVSTQQTLVKWAQIMRDRDSTRNLGLILLTAVLRFKDSSSTNSCVALRKVPVPVNLSVKWANGNTTTE